MICTYLFSRGLILYFCCLGSFELSRTQNRLAVTSTLFLFSPKGSCTRFPVYRGNYFLSMFLSGSQYKTSGQPLKAHVRASVTLANQHTARCNINTCFSVAFGVILVFSFNPGLPSERKAVKR